MKSDEIHRREVDFHNEWAAATELDKIRVREAFESPTAMENHWILQKIGPIAGKRVLDLGAGLGESSVYFALMGADVTTSDISPRMVELAISLGEFHGVNIKGLVAAGENLEIPENHFDIIYTANTIHHVTDKRQFFIQMQRALKPGGRFFSWDPLAYNPIIEIYRRMATDVRTEDEAPLTFKDVNLAREYFNDVEHREFWIASLALFLKYYLIDRIHPNKKRYWKLIYEETNFSLLWWLPLKKIDSLLTKLPLVRRLAWNIVITGRKPHN